MTNPMRHNLKRGLTKKGVIESTSGLSNSFTRFLKARLEMAEAHQQSIILSYDAASMGLITEEFRLAD